MNFYTLTYDADLPAVQQVNVPTNSDYKIGMKVKRNGEVQQLAPDEFTIYTGEINVIPPTQYTTTTKECEDSGALQMANLKEADLSAVVGKPIDKDNVWLEFSFDNGTTWEKLIPDHDSVVVNVNDRSSGSNNYIAQLNLTNPGSKWILQDHGVATGETADYVVVPETPRIMMTFLGSNFTSITSYPCLWRFIFLYGGQEIPVTIPVDQEKTNGYVTITKSSGDGASFRQYGVHIDKGYDFNDIWKITGQFGPTETTPPANFTKPSAEELGIVGITIDGEQFANTAMKITWSNASTPAPANPDDWGNWRSFNINTYAVPYQIGYEGETAIYLVKTDPNAVPAGTVLPDGTVVQEGYNFLRLESGAQNYSQASTTWTMTEDSYIYQGPTRFRANYYFGTAFKFQLGTPFSADFKLNINEFKSQSGDIAETLADGSSVKVDGTYADGTTFSFDFCTK